MRSSYRTEIIHLIGSVFGSYSIARLNLKGGFTLSSFVTPFCQIHGEFATVQAFEIVLNERYRAVNTKHLLNCVRGNRDDEEGLRELRELLVVMKERSVIYKRCETDLFERERSYSDFLCYLYHLTREELVRELLFHREIKTLAFYKENMYRFRSVYLKYIKEKQNLVEKYVGTVFDNPYEAERVFMRPVIHLFAYIETFNIMKHNCFRKEKRFSYLEEYFKEIIGMANKDMLDRSQNKFGESKRDASRKKNRNVDESKSSLRHKEMQNEKISNDKKTKLLREKSILVREDDDSYMELFDPMQYQQLQGQAIAPPFCATIEFGDLYFLSTFKSYHFDTFKKSTVARIGQHFYPDKKIKAKNIDLQHYADFNYFVSHAGKMYVLNNDNDLIAALIFGSGKIDVVIKKSEDDDYENCTLIS